MLSLCSSFTVLSYILSYKFADSLFSRRQNTRCVFQQLEAGVTPEALRHRAAILRPDGVAARPRKTRRERIPGSTRWAGATATLSVAMKWGRSSPLRCFALVQNQRPRETQPQCSVSLPFAEEVNGSVNRSVNRVFHAPFTFPRQKGPLNLIRILPPLPLQRPRKQKCKRQIVTGTGARPGLPSFLIVVFGPLLESWTLLHPSKQLPNAPHETTYETASPGLPGIST